MKTIILLSFCFLILQAKSFSQETKTTTDRVLETAGGILTLFGKQTNKTNLKNNLTSTENIAGKVSVTNKSGKRISFSIKSNSIENPIQKTIVLGIDDMDYISNLPIGSYSYTAKFEDGVIAKSGDIDIGKDALLIEKIIH